MRIRSIPLLLVMLPPIALAGCAAPPNESRPLDRWPIVLAHDFESARSEVAWRSPDPSGWRRDSDGERSFLEMTRPGRYQPPHRSPQGIALLETPALGSFVLEAELMQTGREYDHRDLVFVFGFRDAEHFMYAHLATRADDNAHHVQLVDAAPRRPVTTSRSAGVDWGTNAWRRLRVERDAERGSIRVWIGEASEPVLVADGTAPGEGWLGFGSFDDTGRFADVRVWAPSVRAARLEAFRRIDSVEQRR